ncbi:hypothetical protein WMW72_27830 [Paenibacillus filicis]|uniref:Uncharacterized protein n=1 Tax=Paenibacillus filicis TaxID=669464 RepID=A0ABU9DS57_9BACL
MKTYKLLLSVGMLWFGSIMTVNAVGTTPGSVDDPIITKSYLDQYIAQHISDLLNKPGDQNSASPPKTPDHNQGGTAPLSVIKLGSTQTLYGESGTEFIVRSGKVTVVSSEDGVADVTSGKDLSPGTGVELNHLLIVPREGRGIKPDAKNKQDIFVMVRGGYTILNADGTKVTP